MPVAITEGEIRSILPEDACFTNAFIDYAYKCGDSPVAYHLLNAFGLLAAVAPSYLLIEDITGGTHYANFWGMAVGRPGVEHKTSALKIAMGLLGKVAPERVGSVIGSYEGIVKQLAPPFSTRLAPLTEMGHFLSATQGMGYQDKIKPFLTEAFDCQPYDRPLAGKSLKIPNPRLSILAAVNHDLLQAHATPTDWGGGFMSRWLVLNAETERDDPEQGPTKDEKALVVSWLRDLLGAELGPCEGLTPEAHAFWRAWNKEWRARLSEVSNNAQAGIHGRVPMHAVKLALLWSFDYGSARCGGAWAIDEEFLWRGTQVADMHFRSIRDLASAAQPTEYMRLRFQVLNAIRNLTKHDPLAWADFAAILRATDMGKRRLSEVIDSLISEEITIEFKTVNAKFYYREPPPENGADDVLRIEDYMDPETAALVKGSRRATATGSAREDVEDDDQDIPF